jgi:hypothetical protein
MKKAVAKLGQILVKFGPNRAKPARAPNQQIFRGEKFDFEDENIPCMSGAKNAKNGQKWPKMAKNGQKWAKLKNILKRKRIEEFRTHEAKEKINIVSSGFEP